MTNIQTKLQQWAKKTAIRLSHEHGERVSQSQVIEEALRLLKQCQ